MIPQDTKQIFTSLHESSSAAAAEHRVTWAKPMGFALNNDLRMTDMRRLAVCLLLYWRVICAFMMVYEYSSFFIFFDAENGKRRWVFHLNMLLFQCQLKLVVLLSWMDKQIWYPLCTGQYLVSSDLDVSGQECQESPSSDWRDGFRSIQMLPSWKGWLLAGWDSPTAVDEWPCVKHVSWILVSHVLIFAWSHRKKHKTF